MFFPVKEKYQSNSSQDEILAAYQELEVDAVFESDNTPLHFACSYADSKAVELLIAKGANVNAQNRYGATPLHALAKLEELRSAPLPGEVKRCAELLFSAKASVMRKNESGDTCLLEAAKKGRYEFFEAAAEQGVKLTATDRYGNNALHILCTYAKNAMESLQMDQKRLQKLPEDASASMRDYVVEDLERSQKVALGFLLSVKALVSAGMDVDEKNDNDKTPHDIAISSGAKDIAAVLCGECVDTLGSSKSGGMNLFQAAEQHDCEALLAILQNGAEADAENDATGEYHGFSPLAIACFQLDVEAVQTLLEGGADPNYKNSAGEMALTPWFKYGGDRFFGFPALQSKAPQMILKLLKEHGLAFDATIDDDSNTLLCAACYRADQGSGYNGTRFFRLIADTLLTMGGCDVNAANLKGQTSLMLACALHDDDICNLQLTLLEQGAAVDMADKAGNTPLHYCAQNDHANTGKEMAENLFEFDLSNTEAVNNEQKTALEIAAEQNNEPLVKLILAHS